MSKSSAAKTSKYSLRENVGMFDFRINKNRYGLIRRNYNRAKEIRSKNVNMANKRPMKKAILQQMSMDVTPSVNLVNPKWKLPERSLIDGGRKPLPQLYDVSKAAQFMAIEESSLYEIFNHLSLNDLCAMAEVSAQSKFATQKYFDIMFTAMNLSWLVDDDSGRVTLFQAERLLRNFGHLISTIIVNTDLLETNEDQNKLLALIEKYSNGILFWNTK